jgi:hypothetical protein
MLVVIATEINNRQNLEFVKFSSRCLDVLHAEVKCRVQFPTGPNPAHSESGPYRDLGLYSSRG